MSRCESSVEIVVIWIGTGVERGRLSFEAAVGRRKAGKQRAWKPNMRRQYANYRYALCGRIEGGLS